MSNLGYFALGLGLLVVYLVAMAAVPFGAAGTLAVPMFWAYLVLFAVLCVDAPILRRCARDGDAADQACRPRRGQRGHAPSVTICRHISSLR
jgi:hypothetical protein